MIDLSVCLCDSFHSSMYLYMLRIDSADSYNFPIFHIFRGKRLTAATALLSIVFAHTRATGPSENIIFFRRFCCVSLSVQRENPN